MESVRQDVRHALRMMWSNKGFTAAALLTLALGIGANAAVFSMVYGVLLRPLPYEEPERLMSVWEEHPGANAPSRDGWISNITLDAWLPASMTLEDVAAYSGDTYTIGRENPIRLSGSRVSPSLFRLLRVKPVAGRFFDDREAVEGADGVVILGHRYWQEHFGGSPSALGQTLIVDHRPYTIVGVAPRGFGFPSAETTLWLPFVMPKPDPNAAGSMRVMINIARLRPGATPARAAAEGTAAARAVARPFVAEMLFGKGGPVEVRVQPIVDEMTSSLRPALLVLMTGVGLVLFVACANVANLLLARGRTRQREMAVRAALGAPWRRLARQLLTESLLFGVAGGALGLLVAWILIRTLPVVVPENFPRIDAVQLDWRVLAFSVAVSLAAGLLAGVLPALRGARAGLESTMREGDRRTVGSSGGAMRASLLVVEAALAVVLIVGAGLLVRSFVRLVQVDGGFDPTNVLMAQVLLPRTEPPQKNADGQEEERTAPFWNALLPRLSQVPGVTAVGVANMAPLERMFAMWGFRIRTADGEEVMARATAWAVTPGYAAAAGLRLKSGRFLVPRDVDAPMRAMVVNEEFVRMYLRDGKPVVGRVFPNLTKKDGLTSEVVGIVANVLKDGLDRQPQPEVYVPAGYDPRGTGQLPRVAYLLVRTTGDPLALVPELRRLVRESDPRAALDRVGSMSEKLSASVAQPRFAALLLALFAGLGLAVAATGLYGVLSYSVSERRREIGVRAALGATRGRIVSLVVRQGLAFTLAGLVVGLAAAAATSGLLSQLLFGVTPYDVVAFAIAPIVLTVVAIAACLVPAYRAAVVDPAEALRAE